jgi:hypothetical protein
MVAGRFELLVLEVVMAGQVFSNEEIQNAFRLAYILHPNMAVAYSVALDAVDRFFLQKRLQGRRPKAKNQPFKNLLSDPALLQTSIYLASDSWERDQERLLPRRTPFYKPNVNDLIARYVKLLVWKTMEHNCTHVAVGIGSFLYTYRTAEIKHLAPDHIKDDNIRRIKAGIISDIRNRFEQYNIAPDDSSHIITRAPTNYERELVYSSLTSFAPWVAEHAPPSSDNTPVLETYFGYESRKSEWERNHALIDFGCAGLRLLIQEFNASGSREDEMLLENPDEKLRVPDFGTSFDSGGSDDRFTPPSLSETELISLRRALAQNERRRELYRPGRVRVNVDGKEQILTWKNSTACEEFTASASASYIEVYGDDPSGELLLAVVPLTKLELEHDEEVEIPIEHDDELMFSLFIARDSESDGDFSVRLRHKNSSRETSDLDAQSNDETKSFKATWAGADKKEYLQSPSWAPTTPLRRLLWLFAGAESRILEQEVCVTERSKYSLIGTGVLISSMTAAIAGGYALFLMLGSFSLAITFGLIWGVVILTFDRFLVLSTKRAIDGGPAYRVRHFLTHIVPRLLLASVMAIIFTEVSLLSLFRAEVKAQVAVQNQEVLLKVKENAKGVFSEIDDLEKKISQFHNEIKERAAYRDYLYREVVRERDGASGTRMYGEGPVVAERLRQLRRAEVELDELGRRNGEQIDSYNARLKSLNAEKDKELARVSDAVAQSNGLLSQLSALARLKDSNRIVQEVSWLVMLLVIMLEVMPIIMKLSFAKGLYEEVLGSAIVYNFERYKQELATRPEREVEEKIEDLKNVVNFYSQSRIARSQVS